MKKIFIIFIMVLIFACSSCDASVYKKVQREDEYFKYELLRYKSLGSEYECYITGLTELGKTQTHLILPEFYNDYEILGIGYQDNSWLAPMGPKGNFESSKLEKLYVNFKLGKNYRSTRAEVLNVPNCYVVSWLTGSQDLRFFNHKGHIYGYNFYQKEDHRVTRNDWIAKIGNVSYMYNYEDAPNDGYYWVDNYTNDVIDFIPPVPTREGYEFQGWYKEAECMNLWDFENDILGDDIIIYYGDDITEYTGTYLYAKWNEI